MNLDFFNFLDWFFYCEISNLQHFWYLNGADFFFKLFNSPTLVPSASDKEMPPQYILMKK
jgi:hypothetical protein